MESNSDQQNNKENKFTIPNILGICGIFFLGPVVWWYWGNVVLEILLVESSLFSVIDAGRQHIEIPTMLGILFLFASLTGLAGIVAGYGLGWAFDKKILGIEIGLVGGLSFTPIYFMVSGISSGGPFLISLVGWLIGLAGCYLGKKGGRALGELILENKKGKSTSCGKV